jgi:F0F1-type ATP synthase membrane subunit c/vacuolar-type H+-ATPase subunit K
MAKLVLIAFYLLSFSLCADAVSTTLLALSTAQQVMLFLGFIAIGIGILSSGWALSISLGAYAACAQERRRFAFIPAIMPGSQGIYAFAISFIMIENMASMPLQTAFAGVICGLPCLYSAIGQAKTAAACIKAISNGQMDHGQALLATGVPELYALAGLAGAFLVML